MSPSCDQHVDDVATGDVFAQFRKFEVDGHVVPNYIRQVFDLDTPNPRGRSRPAGDWSIFIT